MPSAQNCRAAIFAANLRIGAQNDRPTTSCARQHQSGSDRGISAVKHRNPLSRGERVRVRAVRLPTSSHSLALRGLSASPLADTRLAIRCVENALNGFIEHRIELSVRLLSRKPFNQRPGKAGDHAMIFA